MTSLTEARFIISASVILVAALFDFFVLFIGTSLDKEVTMFILTALNTNGIVAVVQYWIGSSKGSTDKDSTIAALRTGPTGPNRG